MGWVTLASGIEIPEPAFDSGAVTISTLVNAGRNANGKFVGQVIGNDKLKIDLNWSAMTPDQFQDFLKIWDREQGGKFVNEFTVYDPRHRGYRDMKMYVGDRSGKPFIVDGAHPRYWTEIQANLIEV